MRVTVLSWQTPLSVDSLMILWKQLGVKKGHADIGTQQARSRACGALSFTSCQQHLQRGCCCCCVRWLQINVDIDDCFHSPLGTKLKFFGPWYGSDEMVDQWVHYVTDDWESLQPGWYEEHGASSSSSNGGSSSSSTTASSGEAAVTALSGSASEQQ